MSVSTDLLLSTKIRILDMEVGQFSMDDILIDIKEKNDIKFMNMIRKRDGQVIKSQIGRPIMLNRKFSISVNLGDITKGFGLGGSFERGKMIEYEWIQMAMPEKEEITNTDPTVIKKSEFIQEMDESTKKITGAPFARSSQTLFTGAPIKLDDMRIAVSASSCPVLTINTKKNRWLNKWAIGYYLYDLINRYDTIDKLDLILSEEIYGKFGYTSIKLMAERGTKVRLLTTSSIKEQYFGIATDNLIIKDTKQYRQISTRPKLDWLILVNSKEVHVERFGEDTYSDDPNFITDIQSDFDRLWDIDKSKAKTSSFASPTHGPG